MNNHAAPVAPDIILMARIVHTLTEQDDDVPVTAIGVTAGVISHLGTVSESDAWGPAERIDHRSHVITPGLVDAHIHPIHGQGTARGVFLGGARDLDEIVALLRAEPDDEWLLGWGLQQTIFREHQPSSTFLDEAFPGQRVVLTFFDGHAILASTAAMQAAGIEHAATLPGGGQIIGDAAGRPTGLFLEHGAMHFIRRSVPPLTFAEKVTRVRATLAGMAAVGLTGGEMLDLEDRDSVAILEAIEEAGELPIRLRVAPWVLPRHGQEQRELALQLQGRRGRRWEVRGVKLMIDGTIDNGTAWLGSPDTCDEGTRSLYADPNSYATLLRELHQLGITTTTHAIGDRGVRFVIDAIAALPPGGPRHRIEHLEELSEHELAALAASGASASMQPTHCTHFLAADRSDAWSRRLGDHRVEFAFRTRDVRDAVGYLALGSDWPIAPYDPREIMADSRSRRHTAAAGALPIIPTQALTAEESLRGYTTDVYKSTGVGGGVIEIGAAADFTVFDGDPLAASPDELLHLPVVSTYIAGRRVTSGHGI